MRGAIPPLPQYVFMAWCLVKQRDFTYLLTYLMSHGMYTHANKGTHWLQLLLGLQLVFLEMMQI